MAISFNSALGVHEHALKLRVQRTEVLASNLANADTPGYKARDFDFQQALAAQMGGGDRDASVRTTHARHIGSAGLDGSPSLQYRLPTQPSIDGNTVEEQVEQAEFTKNNLEFQAAFTFLNSRFSGLQKALRGE